MFTAALLIPCYNAEKYLLSLKKQIEALDPKFDEVILVDDGSTDRTVERGMELGLAIEPLGMNRGPGAARNSAVKKTNAEWIHFHDADDEIHPNYLKKTIPLASENTDIVLSSTNYIAEKSRKVLRRWSFCAEAWQKDPIGEAFRKGVNTTSSLIRKRKFEKIGGFVENRRCWEDVDLHLRLVLAGACVRTLPDALCTSIRHDRGVSSQKDYFNICRQEFLFEYEKYIPKITRTDLCDAVIENSVEFFNAGKMESFYKGLKYAFRLGWKGPSSNKPIAKKLLKMPDKASKGLIFILQLTFRKMRKAFKIY